MFLSIIAVVCMCAASGFRLFIPFLILCIFGKFGIKFNGDHVVWLYSNFAFYVFAILSFAEIIGYFTPWIDNMLDLISTPVSIFSGIVLAFSLLPEIDVILRWILIILLGAGTALNIQLLTVKSRALSFIFPKGNGNKIVSTIELISSVLISFLVFINPLISLIFLIAVIIFLFKFIINKNRNRSTNSLKFS